MSLRLKAAAAAAVLTAASLLTGGHAHAAAIDPEITDIALTGGTAFILGPTGIPLPSDSYVSTVESLYLDRLGFDGDAQALWTPEEATNTDMGLANNATYIMDAVHQQLATGDVDADNPIWLFGYSQSAATLALVAQQLHEEGVSADDLHFVLVGDSASAHGGFLNAIVPSLPEFLQPLAQQLLPLFGIEQSAGLTTPDYYATDVYTLTGDGYADWPSSILADPLGAIQGIMGMFTTHEMYLGLTDDQIAGATLEHVDGLANYYTIDSSELNPLETIFNAGLNAGVLPDWLTDLLG